VGIVYFNVDYTRGLREKLIGEADRSVINLNTKKTYKGIFTLLKDNEGLHKRSYLPRMFGVEAVRRKGQTFLLAPALAECINAFDKLVKIST
jgi:hypothetical protein